ncbi:MAG: redoxin domain-containing protein [Anaerolineales bacterium]|nr:redoxin domain-containing protein [Anaerolineales bacterium]
MSHSIYGRSNKIFGNPMNPNLITPGALAPDFELDDIHGNRIRLSSFRKSKPIVLAFLRGFM